MSEIEEIILNAQDANLSILAPDDIFAKYESCRIGADKPVAEPEPTYKIHDIPIGSPGTLSSFFGAPKTGKSAVLGTIISRLIQTSNGGDTPNEIQVYNPDRKAIIAIDTEQSIYHHYKNTQRNLRRARVEIEPPHLYNYNIRKYSLLQKQEFITEVFAAASKRHGGICLAVVDGIADFIASPNDETEANAIVEFFDKLAIQYDCHIILVLHFNPNSRKGRGHLGSQLERKSESVLAIKREGDISIIEPMLLRSGGNADFSELRFKYDQAKAYHVFLDGQYIKKKESKLTKLVEIVFAEEHRHKDAMEIIMDCEGCSDKTAKTRIKQLEEAGLIIARKGAGNSVFYSAKK